MIQGVPSIVPGHMLIPVTPERVSVPARHANMGWRCPLGDATGAATFLLALRQETSADTQHGPRIEHRYITSWTAAQRPNRPESSTLSEERRSHVEEKFRSLFRSAKEEVFEDGMDSAFSKELLALVRRYGNNAMVELADLIVFERVGPQLASEALRWLGRLGPVPSYSYRRWLLERALRCSSPLVRDGAALGLASLEDRDSIPYLRQAIEREPCPELRQDMEQVLRELESTRPCPSF